MVYVRELFEVRSVREPRSRQTSSIMTTEPDPTTSAQPNGEQRRDSRVNYDLPVFFYFSAGKRKPRDVSYVKGYTQDISRNGVKLLVETPSEDLKERLQPDAQVDLEIYLPAVFRSKPITGRGVVVWSDMHNDAVMSGIKLVDLDEEARETLKTVAVTLRNVTDDILGDDEDEDDLLEGPPRPGQQATTVD